jgi:glycerol uptake facilitator protein
MYTSRRPSDRPEDAVAEVPLSRACLAEALGTFILVFFGVGAVQVAVLTGALSGLWQVAIVWALGVALGIYVAAPVSGAHLNPAITVAMTAFRGFPPARILPYVMAQVAGAFLAAAVLYVFFAPALEAFETAAHIVRGAPDSERAAMVFGEYFPNPAVVGVSPEAWARVSEWRAMLAEGFGTAILALSIFAVTEAGNHARPRAGLTAPCIGLTVSMVIMVIAPLTQAGLNPARDFGPRLFAWLIGYGSVALPGPRGGCFSVYILAPILGALAGAACYQYVIRRAWRPAVQLPEV